MRKHKDIKRSSGSSQRTRFKITHRVFLPPFDKTMRSEAGEDSHATLPTFPTMSVPVPASPPAVDITEDALTDTADEDPESAALCVDADDGDVCVTIVMLLLESETLAEGELARRRPLLKGGAVLPPEPSRERGAERKDNILRELGMCGDGKGLLREGLGEHSRDGWVERVGVELGVVDLDDVALELTQSFSDGGVGVTITTGSATFVCRAFCSSLFFRAAYALADSGITTLGPRRPRRVNCGIAAYALLVYHDS